MNRYEELLTTKKWLLADGATGTNLFDAGLQTGDAPELWNIEQPEKIRALQQSFVEAGADIILTNSFGGTANRLKLHKAEDRVHEINKAAAELSRAVADSAHGRTVAVAGSLGPTGDILEPLGDLSLTDCTAAFRAQALALKAGGVDVFWIETISSEDEARCAVEAVKDLGLPIVTTLSFDTNGRTMMGITPEQLARGSRDWPVRPHGYGSNCGVGPSEMIAALLNMGHGSDDSDVMVVKSNCGIPEYRDGQIVYSGTAELMAEYARIAVDCGARIIGGCCGTTAEILKAMRQALDTHEKRPKPTLEEVVAKLGSVSAGAQDQNNAGPVGAGAKTAKGAGRRRKGRPPERTAADDGKFPGEL